MPRLAPGTPATDYLDPPTPPISEPELRIGFTLFVSDNSHKKRYKKFRKNKIKVMIETKEKKEQE
jgi:hypothetical protein